MLALSLRKAEPKGRAAWLFKAHDLTELAAYADVIVIGKAGVSAPSRVAYADNGEDELPFEIVDVKVLTGLKGAQVGDTLVVERAGGVRSDGVKVEIEADGGDFVPEEQDLLFLRRQETGTGYHYIVNDQSRYKIRNGVLYALDEDEHVCEDLHGQTVDRAVSMILTAMR
jgi:hypothetical protein